MFNKDLINPMLTGEQLIEALRILPKYDDTIRDRDKSTRLVALSDLYNLYLPSVMSEEIYSKLYLSLLRSLNKKNTINAVRQANENFKAVKQMSYQGIMGGSDSFTIIGCSGIGKSSAISRAVDLITDKSFVEFNNTKICPVVVVQCPFDSSVKGLAFEIFRKIDDDLETNYYINALRSHATTDILIGIISQVALNHIGLLIIDEIQNVASSKNGKTFIHAITQLINNSGISICMVGTPECKSFFGQKLCHALDEAKILCHSKEDFIRFMRNKGFEITRYTDRHITFQKVGEEKKIRADTLAKQFGDYYTKENLERMMGYYSLPKPLPPREAPPQKPFISEFEKYEKVYIKKHPPLAKPDEVAGLQQKIRQSKNPLFFLLRVLFMLMLRRHKKLLLDKRYFKMSIHTHQKKFKTKKLSVSEQLEKYKSNPIYEGNIPYSRLIHSQGENCVIRFDLSAIPKLYACPIFFSAKLYNDRAMVTIKERDKKLLLETLKLKDETIIDRHTQRYLPDARYDEMKKRAEYLGVQVEFLLIDEKEIDKLTKEKDRYVTFPPENGKVKLAFLPQNKDYVLHCLYPDKHQAESDDLFSVTRNSKVNTRLKSEALLNGKQMRYRTLTRVEVEELHKQTGGQDMFAVFSKGKNGQEEQYNVAYKEDDEKKIENIIGTQSRPRFRR